MWKPQARWVVLVAMAVAILVVGRLMIAHYTSATYLERRLSLALVKSGDSLDRITIGNTRTSLWTHTFTVTDLVVGPDSALLQRWREAGQRPRTQYIIHVPSLRLTGIGFWALLHGGVSVGSAIFESPTVDVRADGTVPPGKTPDSVPLPHQSLRGLRRPIHIGSIKVLHGEFRYSERALDGTRFGRIQFEDLGVAVSALTSHPSEGAASPPVRINVEGLVAGDGKMEMAAEYDIASPRLTMSYHGSVGRMDPKGFNDILVNLEGAEIIGGRLDSVSFDVKVLDGVATGSLQALYHDLAIKVVRKSNGGQGLDDIIKTFLNKNFKLKAVNPEPGKPPRMAPISLVRQPDVRLVKFLWRTIRQGITETLGL